MTTQQKTRGGVVVAALTAFVAVGYLMLPQGEPVAAAPGATLPEAGFVRPETREIVERDRYSGRFVATEEVEVRARVSGYLERILVTPGQLVQEGDILFELDRRTFRTELAAARAEAAGARAALERATAEAARGERLAARNALSREAAEQRAEQLAVARATLEATRARARRLRLDVEFTTVRAPITGRVGDAYVDAGNLVTGGAEGGTVLATIVAVDPIDIEFTVSEADYLKYVRLDASGDRPGSRDHANAVRIRLLDEDEFVHEGRMTFVDNRLDRQTGTMLGRATFDNAGGLYTPGMFAELELPGSGAYPALLVPERAIQRDQGEPFLWVLDDRDAARRAPVVLGPVLGHQVVIREGLDAEAQVLVDGTQFIADGAQVRPVPVAGATDGAPLTSRNHQ
ncbi:MAG: efflux RND transporter periplasmic adaptor subunit [Myxococcota bacterium]